MRLDFCMYCLEDFRLDDTGGYNPPCECGLHCRDCHEERFDDADEPDWQDSDVSAGMIRKPDGPQGGADT